MGTKGLLVFNWSRLIENLQRKRELKQAKSDASTTENNFGLVEGNLLR
ncbi:MAG: hypothetical protein ACTSV7_10435 [Candidatus Baldrarchaeia archaeon]